jgi:hypothetical protein
LCIIESRAENYQKKQADARECDRDSVRELRFPHQCNRMRPAWGRTLHFDLSDQHLTRMRVKAHGQYRELDAQQYCRKRNAYPPGTNPDPDCC